MSVKTFLNIITLLQHITGAYVALEIIIKLFKGEKNVF